MMKLLRIFLGTLMPLSMVIVLVTEVPAVSGAERAVEARNTDLTRFLPADGNTVYPAAGLLRSWTNGSPKLLWQTEVGGGRSAVVEANGRAFTAGQSEGKQWGICLDPKSGSILWKRLLSSTENHHNINGPVASPVIDGERVYFLPYENLSNDIYYPHSPVICLKTNGTELWRESEKYWGTEGSTPLVVGDTLYVCSTGTNHLMVAVDRVTGKLRWGTPLHADPANINKKVIFGAPASVTYQEVAGIPQVICGVYGTHEIVGIDARNGEIMWHFPYPEPPISNGLISAPVAVGSRLFLSGGENEVRAFSACLEMIPQDGKLTAKTIYVDQKLQANRLHTVAVYQDAVFGFGGSGMGGLQCTRFDNGQLLWEVNNGDWARESQLIIADGLIFALTRHGELVLAVASRERYQELGRIKLPVPLGNYPQQPTLANGHLYIRGDTQVLCYQIAGP